MKGVYVNVQALRAVAALCVVWAHLKEIFPRDGLLTWLPIGLVGVDLFFVISGFIMVASTAGKVQTPADFLAKRVARVVPLYYAITALVIAITLVAPSAMKASTSSLSDVIQSFLFIPFYKSPDRIYPTFFLGWTLNYEMFFYAIFALAIAFGQRWRVAVACAIVLGLVALGVIFRSRLEPVAPLYTWTRIIMLDFVVGMLIAVALPALARLRALSPALLLFGTAVGVLAMYVGDVFFPVGPDDFHILPGTDTIWRYGLPSGLIVLCVLLLEEKGWAVRNRLLLSIGDASYSLYLTHFLIVGLAITLSNRFGLGLGARCLMALATLGVCLVVAHLSFRWLELPAGAFLRKRLRPRRPVSA